MPQEDEALAEIDESEMLQDAVRAYRECDEPYILLRGDAEDGQLEAALEGSADANLEIIPYEKGDEQILLITHAGDEKISAIELRNNVEEWLENNGLPFILCAAYTLDLDEHIHEMRLQ